MTYDTAQDLEYILGDLDGVDVVKAGSPAVKGKKDEEDVIIQDEAGASVKIRQTVVYIRTGALALVENDQITVGGAPYRVRDPQLFEDGKLTRVVIARA